MLRLLSKIIPSEDQGNMAIAGTLPLSDQGELQGVAIFRVRSRLPG
jgi:hypothetical protein